MQHGKLIFNLSLSYLFLIFLSCGNHTTGDSKADIKFCLPDSLMGSITFDTVRSEQAGSELNLSGRIDCNEDKVSKIFPMVSGRVTEVKVKLGDFVEKGKVLAIIESSDMANFFNEWRASRSELAIAKKNLEVTGDMRNSGISSEKDLLIAQNEYQKALAENNRIKEVLTINGWSFGEGDSTGSGYVIKSPISGFVIAKNITAGMNVRPDAADVLFTVSDLKNVWAIANVYETDIVKIKAGSYAVVIPASYPDNKFAGRVERISEILDPDTRLMSVKIGLDNPEFKLKPGMFAQIKIQIPEYRTMLAIRSNSIIYDENKAFVVRFRNKCDMSIQPVSIFRALDGKSFVTSDSLKSGDLTISRNSLFVYTAIKNQ